MPRSREELKIFMLSSHKLAHEAFASIDNQLPVGITPDGKAAVIAAYGAVLFQTAIWDDVDSSDIAAFLREK